MGLARYGKALSQFQILLGFEVEVPMDGFYFAILKHSQHLKKQKKKRKKHELLKENSDSNLTSVLKLFSSAFLRCSACLLRHLTVAMNNF